MAFNENYPLPGSFITPRLHALPKIARSLVPTRPPQLVAGPIERASKLLPQISQRRHFDFQEAVSGMRLILWGMFKKVVVADTCAIHVNKIFDHPETYGATTLVLGAMYFAIQVYGDFSGYSDIAIGTARLFGIRLSMNFRSPFFARDIAEFWRRWHISLTTWFRDYLYHPLGGSRGGQWQTVRNTFAIFLVSGFWHGANWTFVTWGLIHALLFLPLLLTGRNRKNTEDIVGLYVLLVVGMQMRAPIGFGNPTLHAKWRHVQAQPTGTYNHLAIGSSRILCHIMPAVFDSVCPPELGLLTGTEAWASTDANFIQARDGTSR